MGGESCNQGTYLCVLVFCTHCPVCDHVLWYLDYNSHHPSQHKRSVVNTLLQRAQEIPSTNAGRSRERRHVIKVLKDNNYPLRFIRSCKSYHNSLRRDSRTNDTSSANAPSMSTFVVLPYVKGVSERISRVLRNNGVKVGYKPFNVLRTCFPVPNGKPSPCSAKVLFTRSAALIATSCTMDKRTEP